MYSSIILWCAQIHDFNRHYYYYYCFFISETFSHGLVQLLTLDILQRINTVISPRICQKKSQFHIFSTFSKIYPGHQEFPQDFLKNPPEMHLILSGFWRSFLLEFVLKRFINFFFLQESFKYFFKVFWQLFLKIWQMILPKFQSRILLNWLINMSSLKRLSAFGWLVSNLIKDTFSIFACITGRSFLENSSKNSSKEGIPLRHFKKFRQRFFKALLRWFRTHIFNEMDGV